MDPVFVESTLPDPVKQFSVFTENKVGRLSDLIKFFARHSIHVMAVTTMDTTDSAILRVVVDDPTKARSLLQEEALAFAESSVLAVEIDGEHDLERALSSLLEAEINIHYMYSFISRPNGKCALAMSIEDMDIASDVLSKWNVKTLSQRDIAR